MTKKMKLLAAALSGLGAMGLTGLSRTASAATLEVGIAVDGSPTTALYETNFGFTALSPTVSVGGVTVKSLLSSSDNGFLGGSDLLSATNTISNTDGVHHVVTLYVAEDGYTLPSSTPLNVSSSLTGNVVTGSLLSGAFQSFADKNNTLFATVPGGVPQLVPTLASSVNSGATSDFTNGPQAVIGTPLVFSGVVIPFGTGEASGSFNWNPVSGHYSLTSIVTLDIGANSLLTISDGVEVTAMPLPATASMGLGLFGVIGAVGGLNALRRRRAVAAL